MSNTSPQCVFAAGVRDITAMFRNPTSKAIEADLRFRLYQASSATLIPLAEPKSWKLINLPSGQTALELVQIELPPVRGETLFHLVWYDGQKKIGTVVTRAFPVGLLKPIQILAGDAQIGLLDPEGKLESGFGEVPVKKLKDAEDLASCDSSLIIIAPISAEDRRAGLLAAVKSKARTGSSIVWIQPPAIRPPNPALTTYIVSEGSGTIVVATASTVDDFTNSPLAQLSLVSMAELATGHRKLDLPPDPKN